MKIRVLRIMHRINVGGPTHHAGFLTKYINNEIFESFLISGQINDEEASGEYILDEMNVKVHYLKNMRREINLINDIKTYFEVRRIIKKYKPHIVHTHAAKSGAIGRLAAYHEKVSIIVHTFHGHVFHSYFGFFKTKFYKSIESYLAKRSNKIIAISKRQKYELSTIHKICEPQHIQVINLGFNLNKFKQHKKQKRLKFRNEFNITEDEIAIGIVGRLTHIKNQKLFIELIAKISSLKKYNVKGFIIGDGEDFDFLRTYATKKNLTYLLPYEKYRDTNLVFTSWRKDMDYVYNGLDIVCLTSLNEGTPVTLIEALASGKPVVSTNVGGVIDVVSENKSGFIVKKNNLHDLYDKTLKLIRNKKLREDFSEYGRKYVFEKFSYLRLVSEIEELYKKLLNYNLKI